VAWRKRIKGTIGDRPIDEIGLDDLNAIVAGCTYDPAKDVRDLMSILFQRAIVDRQTTVNPAPMMTLPLQQSEEVVPWNASEISTLWKAWGNGERVAGYCLLMIYSGMMTGELLRCKEDMINWDDQQIIGCGLKTKKRKEMPIHFPHIIEPILRELCATKSGKRGGEGYILDVSERAFYERFAKMKTALDIRPEVRPYSSRHSTGTELTLMGVEPAIIIDIMRHKNYTTTLKHYTKIPSNVLVDALNAMAEHDKSVITGV
jgi:integrase